MNAARSRLAAFAASGFIAAVAGALLAYQQGSVDREAFTSFDPNITDPRSGLKGAVAYLGDCQGCNGKSRFGNIDYSAYGPRLGLAWSFNASATRSTTYLGIPVLISPASSMKRVLTPWRRAAQVR